MGYDDLSAAVVFDLTPGQDLPPRPPAPANRLCPCPAIPDQTGACPERTHLATVSRQDGSGAVTKQCLPIPYYNVLTQQFAWSTCWVWSCLPLDFRSPYPDRVKPYTITLRDMPGVNLDKLPGGVNRCAQSE